MTKKIYALLVGINEYKNPYKNLTLSGCVNDIEVIQTYLGKRIDIDKQWELVEKKLINESATRQNIIDAFQQHLCQADKEDIVLFYYAGHGSYEPAPDIFRTLNQDRQLETIVCYDSKADGVLDLADKELNYLIEQLAQKNPHILVILDCCYSGTATREPNVVERQAPSTTRIARNLQDFIFPEAWINKRLSGNYNIPRHIAIAACREHQTAKEYRGNNQQRGAFSYFLTEALHRATSLSYVDLVREINALITGKVDNQSPQIEGGAEDCRLTFLGGAIGERTNYLNLYYDEQTHHSWMIDGGILHGIRPIPEGNTVLTIFPKDLAPKQLLHATNAICKAKVSEVMTECSKAELLNDSTNLSKETAYWAVIVEVPLPKLKVYFTGNEEGVKLAKKALNNSIFVQEVAKREQANYYLEAINNQYWIKLAVDKRPLVAPIPEEPTTLGYTSQDANQIIKRLENIARWQNILDLKTPATSQIQPGDIEMEIIITSGSNKYSSKEITSEMRGEYTLKSDCTAEPPRVEVKVTNNTDKTLYFHIIELAESYGICVPKFFEERSSVCLNAQESISSKPIKFGIPSEYVKSGVTEYDGIFKLIASTREFNATLLEQKGVSSPPPQHRSSAISGTLNRLMNKVYTREPLEDDDEYIDNWMTQEVKVTYIKPLSGVEIQQSETTTIIPGVQLQNHSTFKGRFSLKPLPPTSRSTDSNIIPPTFIELINLFQFNATTRDASGISSVLEITNVENHETVTPENPLKIVVQNREGLLKSEEHLLITAYDGEFFLPIGKGKTLDKRTEITIDHLPAPTVNSRSLHGSIIILFQKLIYKILGKEFAYPLLRSVEVSQDRYRAVYEQDKEKIKLAVSSCEKILLYIHGIIGDTASLVPSLRLAKFTENGQEKTLRDKYDLVLTFDYENIHTTIEDNAKFLKQRLEEIGLGANHGKQLHIIAHSMGGLVSRTFIEKEGGNQVVQHLVMLGTPNAGSPWPRVQDWAFMCLGIGLNQLSTIVWPANILAALLAFLEVNDHALEQMNPNHSFIINITTNPDPNVKYTIIAGDCSIKEEAYSTELEKQSKIIRLLQKLFSSTANSMLDAACNLVFKEPNDIAVTLQSIKSVNPNRNPQPRIISPDVTCDHLTYFSSQAGLDALIKALSDSVL